MKINIAKNGKRAEIWITSQEKISPCLPKQLKSLCADFKMKGYTVAVFNSGKGDLFECTKALLRVNRSNLDSSDILT